MANSSRRHAARLISWAWGAENAGVENAGVDKVWKAIRIKYSVDSIWLPQFPRVWTNNLEHTPT